MKKGFTLVELLVVVSIIAVLAGILLPVMARARHKAKVVAVNSDLRQISLAIDLYCENNWGKHPPTKKSCGSGWDHYTLPPELARLGYLPEAEQGKNLSVGMEDLFNKGQTYKYQAVGELFMNGMYVGPDQKSELWVPTNFPHSRPEEEVSKGDKWDDPKKSPVTWVLFSEGKDFDWWEMKLNKYPLPRVNWYSPKKKRGIITRVRLIDGTDIGTFNGDYGF